MTNSLCVILFTLLAGSAAGLDQRAMDEAVSHSLKQSSIPGVVVMAADPDGVIYSGAFGKHGSSGDRPLAQDAIFRIYSMTKAVTSVAAMQLVEQGQIALDQSAESYVPELAKVQVLEGFSADGIAKFRAPARPPTVRHLLTHTAGFGYPIWGKQLTQLSSGKQLAKVAVGNGRELVTVLLFDPGTDWQYGISTGWLGVLVERVSGQSLEEYFQEHVL